MLSIAPALALLAVSASAHPLLTNNHVARHHALAARSEQLADPAGWFHDYLEDYTTYHTRYLAVGCKGQQATEFFESCCHPLLATETLEANRPAECNPANVPASAPTDTEDEEDCEEDEPEASPAASPAPTEEAKPEEAAPSPSPTEEAKPADKPADKPAATTTSETAAPTEDKNNSGNSGNNNSGGEVFSGGRVTWFEQAGGQGHCGEFHGDDDLIAAMSEYSLYCQTHPALICFPLRHRTIQLQWWCQRYLWEEG